MDAQQLIRRLQDFGLDAGEATVYFQLCRLGGARAAEAAAAAQRKRPDTYRLLDSLVRKGFAEKTLERPTRFLPVEIGQALERTLEARREETRSLDGLRSQLAAEWPRPHGATGPESQRFTVFQGKEQVHGLIGRMLRSAREDITIVASPGGLARLGLRNLLLQLAEDAGQQVHIRLLAKPDAFRDEVLADLAGVAQIRYAELPSYHQMIIVDSQQIALFISGGRKLSTRGEEESVLWLNSPDFVLAQTALFDVVWATALDQSEREAADREGRLAHGSWLLRGRWQRIDRMRRMASRARGRVAIVAPSVDTARWRAAGLAAALEAQARQGVEVWVWSDRPCAVEGATFVRLGDAPPAVEMLVDGREVVTAMGSAEAPEALAYDAEHALWSTHPDQVRLVAGRLAALPEAQPLVRLAEPLR